MFPHLSLIVSAIFTIVTFMSHEARHCIPLAYMKEIKFSPCVVCKDYSEGSVVFYLIWLKLFLIYIMQMLACWCCYNLNSNLSQNINSLKSISVDRNGNVSFFPSTYRSNIRGCKTSHLILLVLSGNCAWNGVLNGKYQNQNLEIKSNMQKLWSDAFVVSGYTWDWNFKICIWKQLGLNGFDSQSS